MANENTTKVILATRDGKPVYCARCGTRVHEEHEVEGYPYYCPEHDENLYTFETTLLKRQKRRI